MTETKNLLLVVATTEPANQYASYVIAFMAKKLSNVPNVTIFYGPNAVSMAKKGESAKPFSTWKVAQEAIVTPS